MVYGNEYEWGPFKRFECNTRVARIYEWQQTDSSSTLIKVFKYFICTSEMSASRFLFSMNGIRRWYDDKWRRNLKSPKKWN